MPRRGSRLSDLAIVPACPGWHYAYCKACHPGAIERRWTRDRVLEAMLDWSSRYGRLPSSYDWSRTHACRRGGEALRRLEAVDWPAPSVVTALFGTWTTARESVRHEPGPPEANGRPAVA